MAFEYLFRQWPCKSPIRNACRKWWSLALFPWIIHGRNWIQPKPVTTLTTSSYGGLFAISAVEALIFAPSYITYSMFDSRWRCMGRRHHHCNGIRWPLSSRMGNSNRPLIPAANPHMGDAPVLIVSALLFGMNIGTWH